MSSTLMLSATKSWISQGPMEQPAVNLPVIRVVRCIYEWYRNRVVDSDDEAAVTFHPETLEPLSVPRQHEDNT